jgi:hypothetical protein
MSHAIAVGLLAGVWHGLFSLLLSLLGLAGAGGLLNELRPIVSAQDLGKLESTLTGIGGLMFKLLGVVIDMVFGHGRDHGAIIVCPGPAWAVPGNAGTIAAGLCQVCSLALRSTVHF